MTENHTISIKCNMCDKTFKKSSDLDEHILATHDSMEKVNCKNCGKEFVETSNIRISTLIKNFKSVTILSIRKGALN